MGLSTHEFTAGGEEWSLNTLAGKPGAIMLTKIAGIVGGPLAKLAEGIEIKGSGDKLDLFNLEVTGQMLGGAIEALTTKIADDRTIDVITGLLKGLRKRNEKGAFIEVNFDLEFAGNYGVLAEIVAKAVEINYSSFFAASPVVRFLAAAGQRMNAQRQTPPTSTGEFSES